MEHAAAVFQLSQLSGKSQEQTRRDKLMMVWKMKGGEEKDKPESLKYPDLPTMFAHYYTKFIKLKNYCTVHGQDFNLPTLSGYSRDYDWGFKGEDFDIMLDLEKTYKEATSHGRR